MKTKKLISRFFLFSALMSLCLSSLESIAMPPLEIPNVEKYYGDWTPDNCSSEHNEEQKKRDLPNFRIQAHANGKDLDIFYVSRKTGQVTSSVFSTAGGTKVKENGHEGGQALITTSEATMIADKIVVGNVHKYTGLPSTYKDQESGEEWHAWLLAVDVSSIKMAADGKTFEYYRKGYSHEVWQQQKPEKGEMDDRTGPYSIRCTFTKLKGKTKAEPKPAND